jgi:hypothetical protein
MGYCRSCATWRDALPHEDCTQAADDSALLVNCGEGFLSCTRCQQIWLIEPIEIVCPSCNQSQQITFAEDTVHLQREDRVLAVEGSLVYILVNSETLVIAPRRNTLHLGPA